MANKGINVFSLYVEKEFAEGIKKRAKQEERSASSWIRLAVLEKMRREDSKKLNNPC